MPNIYLEDVYITGFKSFSEKTGMSFNPGIGVIVGKQRLWENPIF